MYSITDADMNSQSPSFPTRRTYDSLPACPCLKPLPSAPLTL